MNQDKLEVVKQEMTRVNVNILGISELKWTGMGKFNSDDHYIYISVCVYIYIYNDIYIIISIYTVGRNPSEEME